MAIVARRVTVNSATWLGRATPSDIVEGKQWYAEAMAYAEFLSVTFNISKVVAAAVISALSPNNKWERNKIDAFNLIQAWWNADSIESVKVCTYNANKVKAWKVLTEGMSILRKSRKTHAFALNVGMNDVDHVTLDKWMFRAFSTTSKKPIKCQESVTPKQYDELSDIFCRFAKRKGYKPYELQAILWVVIRKEWNT